MPRSPIARPLNTLVTMNATPWTVPTRPFALACRSSGTRSVTVVDSAMFRMCSTTEPNRMMPENAQNHGPPRSRSADSGCSRYSTPAITNDPSVRRLEKIITWSLRWRSTMVPNSIAKNAMSSMYAPPMMPVASTDRVSRYTQKVSANQRKLVVTFAIAVLTSTCTKVRMPPGGGVTPRPAVSGATSAGDDAGAAAPSVPSSPLVTR